jgi:membrane fusion protein (multidrug efflux system)
MGAFDRRDSPNAAAQAPAGEPPAVIVAEVLQKSVPIYNEFVARTEAIQTVEIRARVEGVLEQVLFKQGSEVKEGQTLFVIERAPYDAALQSAKAQLAKAQADLTGALEQVQVLKARAQLAQQRASLGKARQDVARLRPLAKERAVPQQDLDSAVAAEEVAAAGVQAAEATLKDTELQQKIMTLQARAAVESAKAAVTQAELNLGYTTIRAPISGIIGLLNVDKGNLVGRGETTQLATMSSIDPMRVTFASSELDYLRQIKKQVRDEKSGQEDATSPPLELILADGSIYPSRGEATSVDRALDPKTSTILVYAEFPNPDKMLRPGQFGRVRFPTEQISDAVLLPQRAVQEVQGTKTVLVVGQDNKVALRTISVSDRVDQFYVVSKGLKPGERVIVEGQQKARPGMQVMPTTQPRAGGKIAVK